MIISCFFVYSFLSSLRLLLLPLTVCFFFNFLGLGLTNLSNTTWFFHSPTWHNIFWSWISPSFCSLFAFFAAFDTRTMSAVFAAIEYFTDMLPYFVQRLFNIFLESFAANLMMTSNYHFINSDQILADMDSFLQTQIHFRRHRFNYADADSFSQTWLFFTSKAASCSSHTQSTKWHSTFQQK